MWQTRFTERYGVPFPLISAGMGFIARPPLVAAVSEAGGFGLLGVAPAPAPVLREMLEEVRRLTDRPFGVDLIVEETAFGPATTEEHLEICIAASVPVVVFFWNFPPEAWRRELVRAGIATWIQVGTVEAARQARAQGFDAIMIQGREAGGHNQSRSGLASLLPRVVDEVHPTPVIAAGGIADGRGVAAALALGAEAVCLGTRFVAAEEAHAHPEFQQHILRADLADVTRTRIFGPEWPDVPMTVLRNRAVEQAESGTAEPCAGIGRTSLFGVEYPMPFRSAVLPTPETEGDLEQMCLPAGESAALVAERLPAAEIVERLVREAEAAGRRLAGVF